MRQLLLLLLLIPMTTLSQETRTSIGINVFTGYSDNQYLNTINLDNVQQYEEGIVVFRVNSFFEYALTERRKAHLIWGFGFDQSGHSTTEPTFGFSRQVYRQYYLYLPVSFKYKWTNSFYSSIGMAGGALIENRYIWTDETGTYRDNDESIYNEFQLSTTLNLGYEISLKKNRVFFFEAAGSYNWLGKIGKDFIEDNTQRAAWQVGLGIGIMKRF